MWGIEIIDLRPVSAYCYILKKMKIGMYSYSGKWKLKKIAYGLSIGTNFDYLE